MGERIWAITSGRTKLASGELIYDVELTIDDDGWVGLDNGECVGLPLDQWDEMVAAYILWRAAREEAGGDG